MDFIDLYAGIGGIRFAFEAAGGKCVFSSEWNTFSQKTYEAFHGERPFGDITLIEPDSIPDHHILTAGFPCQPFSLAGVSKKNSLGRLHGFEDPTQGTEFFKLKEIIRVKKPIAFLLENVKNLRSHDQKKTFEIIIHTLKHLGYEINYKIIDSSFWVPQHRERIYIIGIRNDFLGDHALKDVFPQNPSKRLVELEDILETHSDILSKYAKDKYTVTPGTWEALKRHKAYHNQKGNGFGFNVIEAPFTDKITRTLSARYNKDGSEILIGQGLNIRPRRLTPLEVFRLQGFPKSFEYLFETDTNSPVSNAQTYKQFGNTVTVPVLTDIAKNLTQLLRKINKQNKLIKLKMYPAQRISSPLLPVELI